MAAPDIRAHLVDEHATLRGKAEVLEALSLRVIRGDEDLGSALRLKGEEIEAALIRHMLWEEEVLLPELRRRGHEAVASQIHSEHELQRERIADSLIALQDAERRPVATARHLLEFIRSLDQDMSEEESSIHAKLLEPRSV